MKNFKLVAMLYLFLTFLAGAEQRFVFISHLLLPQLLQNIYKDDISNHHTKKSMKLRPVQVPMAIRTFDVKEIGISQYDTGLKVTFEHTMPDQEFIFLRKKGFTEKIICKCQKESTEVTNVSYLRDIGDLFSDIPVNLAYYQQSFQVILSLLTKEDIFGELQPGDYQLSFFEITYNVDQWFGKVGIQNQPYLLFFKVNSDIGNITKGVFNLGLMPPSSRIPFVSMTYAARFTIANYYDEKIENGFECMFYPHQGLQFLTNKRNGKEEAVQVWDEDGHKRVVPYKKWFLWRTHQSQEL